MQADEGNPPKLEGVTVGVAATEAEAGAAPVLDGVTPAAGEVEGVRSVTGIPNVQPEIALLHCP